MMVVAALGTACSKKKSSAPVAPQATTEAAESSEREVVSCIKTKVLCSNDDRNYMVTIQKPESNGCPGLITLENQDDEGDVRKFDLKEKESIMNDVGVMTASGYLTVVSDIPLIEKKWRIHSHAFIDAYYSELYVSSTIHQLEKDFSSLVTEQANETYTCERNFGDLTDLYIKRGEGKNRLSGLMIRIGNLFDRLKEKALASAEIQESLERVMAPEFSAGSITEKLGNVRDAVFRAFGFDLAPNEEELSKEEKEERALEQGLNTLGLGNSSQEIVDQKERVREAMFGLLRIFKPSAGGNSDAEQPAPETATEPAVENQADNVVPQIDPQADPQTRLEGEQMTQEELRKRRDEVIRILKNIGFY